MSPAAARVSWLEKRTLAQTAVCYKERRSELKRIRLAKSPALSPQLQSCSFLVQEEQWANGE